MKRLATNIEKKQIDIINNEVLPQIAINMRDQPLIQYRKNRNHVFASDKQIAVSPQNISKNQEQIREEDMSIKEQDKEQNIEQQGQKLGYFKDFFHMMKTKLRMKQVISKTETRRKKILNEHHLSIIHDKASVCELNDENIKSHNIISGKRRKNQVKKQQSKDLIKLILSQFRPLNPASSFIMIWDILQFICFCILGIAITIKMTFEAQMSDLISETSYLVIIVIFFLDIFVKGNTGFYKQGHYYKQRYLIFKYYIKKYFIRDVLAIFNQFLYYLLSNHIDNSYTSPYNLILIIGFVSKMKQIIKISHKIEEYINNKLKSTHFTALCKLLITMLLVGHLFSCVWISIAKIVPKFVDKNMATWFDLRQFMGNSWKDQYLNAFYYSSVTMITVGYGDITPQNNYEILLCLLTIFIACCVFAYTVNSIGHIINEIQQKNTQNKQMKNVIFNYMKLKNISKDLQYEVKQYLEYIWKETCARNTLEEEKVVSILNSNLRQRLLIEANKIVLQDSPIFRDNFSDQVIERTVQIIKEKRYSPEEIIFRQNDIGDANIYFIEQGKVQLYLDINYPGSEKKIQILQQLEKGQSFGHYSFFTGQPRVINVRSKGFVTLLSIDRNSFIHLLQEYQEDYEQFCEIKEEVLYQSMFNKIGLRCHSCGKTDHLVDKCRLVHYQAPYEQIIAQQNHKQLKRQLNLNKNIKQKFHSLLDFEKINLRQDLFIQQNYDLMQLYAEVFLSLDEQSESDSNSSDQNEDDDENSDSENNSHQDKQNEISLKNENNIGVNFQESMNFDNKYGNDINQTKKITFNSDINRQQSREMQTINLIQEKNDQIEQNENNEVDTALISQKPPNLQFHFLEQLSLKDSQTKNLSQSQIDNIEESISPVEHRNYQIIKSLVGRFNRGTTNQDLQYTSQNSFKQLTSKHSFNKQSSQIKQEHQEMKSKLQKQYSGVLQDFSNVNQDKQNENDLNNKGISNILKNSNIEGEKKYVRSISILKKKMSSAMKKAINKIQEKTPDMFSTAKSILKQTKQKNKKTNEKLDKSQSIQQIFNERKNLETLEEIKKQVSLSDNQNLLTRQLTNNQQLLQIDKQKNFRKYFPHWNLNFIVFKINLAPKYLKEQKRNLRENAIKFLNNQSNFNGQMKNIDQQDNQLNKFKEFKKHSQIDCQLISQLNEQTQKQKQRQSMFHSQQVIRKSMFVNSQSQNINYEKSHISETSQDSDEQSMQLHGQKSQMSISHGINKTQNKQNSKFLEVSLPYGNNSKSDRSRFQSLSINYQNQAQEFLMTDLSALPPQLNTSINEKIESESHINTSYIHKNTENKNFEYKF